MYEQAVVNIPVLNDNQY